MWPGLESRRRWVPAHVGSRFNRDCWTVRYFHFLEEGTMESGEQTNGTGGIPLLQ